MMDPDRPWLYTDNEDHATFVALASGFAAKGHSPEACVHNANAFMDTLERIRSSGGVVKEQVPPKQPRIQPVDDQNQIRTFFRTPDGVTYIVGMMGNLEIKEGNSKIIIQRADLEEALNHILREFYGKKIIG